MSAAWKKLRQRRIQCDWDELLDGWLADEKNSEFMLKNLQSLSFVRL